ncbi:MAG TPA: Gfo/Idh/MocA family oxidoreductase, partial [Armatimonadota bacterium]|nr:Gfo/Idh/MocA family oxidoreductase [Armatimonadota bacterium]
MIDNNNLNRRNFLRGIAAGAVGAGALLEEMRAAEAQNEPAAKPDAAAAARPAADEKLSGPPVGIAVIGLGSRGREILTSLARVGPVANIVSICDKFSAPVFVKRAAGIAPKATFVDDYKKVLADKNVQAVFIATPTHQHRQIAVDAIAAGKHVYCEAPLAHTVEDARAIAVAGKGAKTVFQSGLQNRANHQALHVGRFIQTSALGSQVAEARAQWHNKTSWRQANPAAEREAELNWRLRRETSPGLMGEVGIHQVDTASWYLKARPVSVSGFGGIMLYNDGRTVPDTVQCVVEYPNKVRLLYDATLTNSFDGAYELFLGNDASIMLRDQRAWMFKEAGASQLGWEVFARKDEMLIGDVGAGSGVKLATGIALVADATKQLALGKQPGQVGTDVTKTALYQAVE